MKPTILAGAIALLAAFATPAEACLSCSCGGSGVSGDMGAVGGAASFFSMGSRWLIQEGVSFRSITGSFNERGDWNPAPTGGSLLTLQGSLGVTYFPTIGSSVSVQLPAAANSLDKASWGPLGSINPTDLPRATGYAFGDVLLQGSYKFYEAPSWAVAGFLGGSLPTGQAAGSPESLAGAGVANGLGGLLAIGQFGDLELLASVGMQRPFGRPPLAAGTFYIGDAWLYQAQGNYRLDDRFRVGLGLSGTSGEGRFGTNELAFSMAKLKLIPSLQYAWAPDRGVRLALGYDPARFGANSMTDVTAYAIFYQYAP